MSNSNYDIIIGSGAVATPINLSTMPALMQSRRGAWPARKRSLVSWRFWRKMARAT